MAPSIRYWDDWVDPEDMAAMWAVPDVYDEWISAGEKQGQKVHLSRDPDGQPSLTQTEMKEISIQPKLLKAFLLEATTTNLLLLDIQNLVFAYGKPRGWLCSHSKAMVDIIIDRHFKGRLDTIMICAIAEIESNRQPFAYRYEPKLGEASTGVMQTLQSTAEWLARDMGYRAYELQGESTTLYRPFVSVYFGAAFLKWLSTYDGKKRSEEFMVRAYNGGPKRATHKSTLRYWTRYQLVKQELPVKSNVPVQPSGNGSVPSSDASSALASNPSNTGREWSYWDDKVSREDMMEMWKNPEVRREWTKDGEIEGKVRFSRDSEKRPYLTTIELKAVAEIIVSRHFASNRIKPVLLASLAEISSMRLLYGSDPPNGIMQIGFPTAVWLYKDLDYTAYKIRSLEDLSNPFVSMYFGTAYVSWLSTYEGRERSDQFIIQAYMGGPQGVNVQETGPFWLKYLDTLPKYETRKKASQGGCAIL